MLTKTTGIILSVFLLMSTLSSAQNISFTSQLPIFYLNTSGQTIPDDPKIQARLEVAWKKGGTNSTSDTRDHFKGNITIEVRGSSSQSFPKKSYGFELKDDQWVDMDFSLLDLPGEEDWILYAPYSDKSLLRNVLTFTLAAQLSDDYVPRCRFVELFLNNNYEGVYVLMEKIKRGNDRVDIARLRAEDISGEELTGGYIVKIDKSTGSGGDGWSSDYLNRSSRQTFYQYEYPKEDEILPEQKAYIHQYIDGFETAVKNLWHGETNGYQNYINAKSFYDYAIINEFTRNIDGYRLSSFLNKDKNGKLNAGPIWDYNLAYGNANYYDGWKTSGLVLYEDIGSDNWQIPFWWIKLVEDDAFVNPMRCRWEALKETVLNEANVMAVMDSLTNYLGNAVDRNFNRWPILNTSIWPNYYIGGTYANEIDWMKDWISARLNRLDAEFPGTCDQATDASDFENENVYAFYPNPFSTELNLKVVSRTNVTCQLAVYNINGALIQQLELPVVTGVNHFDLSHLALKNGIYLCRITQGGNELYTNKLVKL
ncbi:CotH kinase family protein [Maribellus sp. YY47]|uniref:CotH kinase family protein n=1 Tax=Maribellus sp. YY47 TaxID=2929486 RepID=UPI0020009555|nr:CotH kinase family protein [Maribellus sp. YY47]MCK3683318.1 CotH kinase family protein [Maribellus sp. YY47]